MHPTAMGLIGQIRARLEALRSSERGFAVATVLSIVVIGLGFSAVAVSLAVSSQGETTRDMERKVALGVADAGAQQALFTYNKITTIPTSPCVVKTTPGGVAKLQAGYSITGATSPYCAPVGGAADPDARVGPGYFTYWVHPCVKAIQSGVCSWAPGGPKRRIEIVSQGCSNTSATCAGGIIRRVAITASGIPGSLSTGTAKAIGLDGFTMSGWTELEVPAATNKSFKMLHEGGCPNAGSDMDGQFDSDPLDPRNGCPRICPGDWSYNSTLSIGPSPPYDVETPAHTQICNFGRDTSKSVFAPDGPRVNPPGPPESSVCSTTFNAQDAAQLGGAQCNEPEHRTITLAPVDIGSYKTNNDDSRLGDCTVDWTNQAAYNAAVQARKPLPTPVYTRRPGCTLNLPNTDTTSGPGSVKWDPVSRTLTIDGSAKAFDGTADSGHRFSLNIGGSNYVLCRLVMTNESRLYMTNTTTLPGTSNVASRFFFDSPENCGLPNNTDQISLTGDSDFESQTWNPFAKSPDPNTPPDIGLLPLMMMVGSNTLKTNVSVHTGNFYFPLKVMLYAPRTDITLDTGFARENEGWFAGKTIAMQHGSEIESPPALGSVGVGIAGPDFITFQRDRYVECGPPGSTIDANC